MIKRILTVPVLLVTFLSSFSQRHVQFIISSLLPRGDSNFYLAGSFNGWNLQDKNYHFQKNGAGNYFFETNLADGLHEFKITRGSWAKVECRKTGADIQNRVLKLSSDTLIDLTIEEWADHFAKKPRISAASKNVHVIDTAFLIPQLKR